MKLSPKLLRFLFNIYPPYWGTGVSVRHIGHDWREIYVTMKLRWYNRNINGTHFGGSLYAMVDPHLVAMVAGCLGPDYIVWDKSAEIDYVRATTSTVSCLVTISDQHLDEIKAATQNGEKYLPTFELVIKDEQGKLVARVSKTLYIKRKH